MKNIILASICMFGMLAVYGQEQPTSARSKSVVHDRIIAYQMGSGQTTDGSYTLTFDQPLESEYTVVLTPLNSGAALYIAGQTKTHAIVRSKDGSVVSFQFIVFVRNPIGTAGKQ
jgi:hypothetical protein